MPTVTETITISEKQAEFLALRNREVLFSGAYRAGKTRVGCYGLLRHATIPGNQVGLFRKTLTALRPSTLHTLLYEAIPGPVLEPGSYTHSETKKKIALNGGGIIWYGGCEDYLAIGSMNLGAVFVDEGIEITQEEYNMLKGRLSNPADPNPQIFTATNPGSPSHFLHKHFCLGEPKKRPASRGVVYATPHDNPFLPAHYLETISDFTGQHYERYVLGKWVAFEGLMYPTFNPDVHVREWHEPWDRVVVGVDDGFRHPFVALKLLVGESGHVHLAEEFSQSGLQPGERIDALVAMNADIYVCPPEAAWMIEALQRKGFAAEKADNRRAYGFPKVRSRLGLGEDELPKFTLSGGAVKTRLGFESYLAIDKGPKEDAKKEMDDEMDALRYGLVHIDSQSEVGITTLSDEDRRQMAKAEREAAEAETEEADTETEEERRKRIWKDPACWRI